jgi:hypothetical protein
MKTETNSLAAMTLLASATLGLGQTNFTLYLTNIQVINAGDYATALTDDSGSVTSHAATLTITPFNSIYCFGFSWTDSQGLFQNGSPDFVNNSPQYWQDRASNGPMWPEFLSANLGLVYNAEDNLARGAATSSDTLAQVNNLPSRSNPENGLYIVWVAAGDFLNAADPNYGSAINWTNDTVWNTIIQTVVKNSSNIIERLYAKGARSVVVQNCLDLSLAPGVIRDIGANTNRLAKLKERTARFNTELVTTLQGVGQTRRDLRLFVADIFSRENEVHANPAHYGFTTVITDALDDPSLSDKSFTGSGKDYMFWDGLHGTSKFHQLVAAWTLDVLTNTVLEMLEASYSGNALNLQITRLQIGRVYTLQESAELKNWQDVTSFVASSGTNQWTTALNAAQAFYRLKSQP